MKEFWCTCMRNMNCIAISNIYLTLAWVWSGIRNIHCSIRQVMRCSWIRKPCHICNSNFIRNTSWHVCVESIDVCHALIDHGSMILSNIGQIQMWMSYRWGILITHMLCLLRLLVRWLLTWKDIVVNLTSGWGWDVIPVKDWSKRYQHLSIRRPNFQQMW